MTGSLKIALGAAVVLLLTPCGLGLLAMTAWDAAGAGVLCPPARPAAAASGNGTWAPQGSWSATQVGHAATIVVAGAGLGVPRWGWVVAVATAMQESSLHNLGHLGQGNDHDSLGLFQQRPSQGWGTPAQLLDPAYAATAFYRRLLQVPGWQQLPLTEAAQRVQRSAYPDAYAKWQAEATALVDVIATRLGLTQDCAATAGGWALPLPAGSYTLSSPYGPRWNRFHYGQDLAAPAGTPIHAIAAGTVVSAGCTSPRCDIPGSLDMPGCGLTVKIDHGGVGSMSCHARDLTVHTGQKVAAGQVIGHVGSTGHSSGNHLHLQVHRPIPPFTSATAVEPVQWLRGAGVDIAGGAR